MSHPLRHLIPQSVRDTLNEKIANATRDAARDAVTQQTRPLADAQRVLKAQIDEIARHAPGVASAVPPAPEAIAGMQAQLAALSNQFVQLRAEHSDLATLVAQIQYVLRENDLPPPPPKHLQVRVCGGYVAGFLDSGFNAIGDINAAIAASGRTLPDFRRILDFGCGCGRVLRTLKSVAPGSALYGTDIDGEAIGWLQKHYGRFGEFAVAPHRPPTAYADGMFDFVYGISVFTHLPEDMQYQWLEELRRITAPGAFLMMSTHGAKHYETLPPELRAKLEERGFYYGDLGTNYGASIQLPDFYQTSFHKHDYIRREWGKYFDVVDIQTLRMDQHQDSVLLRRR